MRCQRRFLYFDLDHDAQNTTVSNLNTERQWKSCDLLLTLLS